MLLIYFDIKMTKNIKCINQGDYRLFALFGERLVFDLSDNTLPLLTTKGQTDYDNGVKMREIWDPSMDFNCVTRAPSMSTPRS